MKGKTHTVDSAIRSLANKKVRFETTGKIDLTKADPLGNKSWGKLDFLIKKCGFQINAITLVEYRKQFISA